MTKVLLTGMCSAADRLIRDDGRGGLRYSAFAQPPLTCKAVRSEFERAANLGNYLITEGAYRAACKCDVEYLPFWYVLDLFKNPDQLEVLCNKYDILLFATANILHTDFDISTEVQFLEKWKKQLVLMSVGLQRVSDLQVNLPQSTVRFINLLKCDHVTTFTRGPLTRDFLLSRGVRNIVDACCPSAFAYPESMLNSMRMISHGRMEFEELWLNGYIGTLPASHRDLYSLAKHTKRLIYVYQDEPLLGGVLNEYSSEDIIYRDDVCAFISGPANVDLAGISKQPEFVAFFQPEVWRAQIASADLSIGRRFHGNIIAMQVGRPALFIGHDDRVVDMVSAIGAPIADSEFWNSAADRKIAIDAVIRDFNISEAEDKYMNALARFSDGLRRSGLRT